MKYDEHHYSRREAAARDMGGASAIYTRLDTASDEELRTWLTQRSAIEREVVVLLLSLRLPATDQNADLVGLLTLDERVLYGRLATAAPEFRGRFASYLQLREDCRTGRAFAVFADLLSPPAE